MRNILALVGAATVTFLAVGWYLGWYKVDKAPQVGTQGGLHVQINTDKALKDSGKGLDWVADKVQDFRNPSADSKPAPLSTPQGPASSFFGPAPAAPLEPWKAVKNNLPTISTPKADADDALFGIRIPRR